MKNKLNVNWLAESAVMIALAVVLEVISKMIVPEFAFGGQITIVAMLPVVLVAYKYGIRRGLVTGFAYSLVQMALGAKTISGMVLPSSDDYLGSVGKIILMLLMDYILAFTVLGLSAMYKKSIKNTVASFALGTLTVLLLRYVCHIISGYVLFGAWAEWFFTQDGFYSWGPALVEKFSGNTLSFIYSVIYNGFYMIPETITTTIAAAVVAKFPQIIEKKYI